VLAPLSVLAVNAPLAAWSASGMETGLVTLLATLALGGRIPGAVAGGAAAAWRPELIPWAVVLSAGFAFHEGSGSQPDGSSEPTRDRARRALGRALVVLALPAVVALIRWRAFGHAAPLAVLAKPADLAQGTRYAIAALLGTGPVWLLLAPRAARRLEARERWAALAIAVHFAAIALAGGDWMWMFRLAVPVLPSMVAIGAAIAARSVWPATLVRVVVASAISVIVAWPHARDAREIGLRRNRLIDAGPTALGDAKRIATVDVGWVGAASSAEVVDLAGATDPEIAALPGSHTSKRIHPGLLAARGVDTLVLLLAPGAGVAQTWTESRFARAVEARVARLPDVAGFLPVATLPLGGPPQDYLVVQRPSLIDQRAPCRWLPEGAAERAPWVTLDARWAVGVLQERYGGAVADFRAVQGCSVGLLGSTTVILFHAEAPLPRAGQSAAGGDRTTTGSMPDPARVARMLEFLAKELPGLRLDPRGSAYDRVGVIHEEDSQLNVTDDLLLRRHDTGAYLFIREYGG
jgi:hypothetical protein